MVVAGALYVGAGRAALEAHVRQDPWNWWLFLLYGGGWGPGRAGGPRRTNRWLARSRRANVTLVLNWGAGGGKFTGIG